jgi:hypothetical protein
MRRVLTQSQRHALWLLLQAGGMLARPAGDGPWLNLYGVSVQVLCQVGAVETDGASARITAYGRTQAAPHP